MHRIIYACACIVALFICGCDAEKKIPITTIPATNHWLLVLNQGNFQWNNAGLDLISYNNDSIYSNAFYSINNRNLGDVLQSATHIGKQIYLVVNNSGKVEVLNAQTFESVQTISGFQSPRYVVYDGLNQAFISDLYGQKVYALQTETGKITDTVAIPGWADHLIYRLGKLYVACMNKPFIYELQTNPLKITDSIRMNNGINDMIVTGNTLIAVSANDISKTVLAQLKMMDLTTHQVTQTFTFPNSTDNPIALTSLSQDSFAYINGGVFISSVSAGSLPQQESISGSGHTWYALYCDTNKNIWLSDVKDYVQKSQIYRYSPTNKTMTGNWKAGIICGGFLETK